MKSFIVLALCVAVAVAIPVTSNDKDAHIIRQELDNIGVEGFQSGFETSNGISASTVGQLKGFDKDAQAVVVRGQYSYLGPDGVTYTIDYTADENGFHPQGAHLPVAPQ